LPNRTEYVTPVWEIDPGGARPARRLTRGAKGESAPAFTSDGDLLFTAVRPTDDDDEPPAALWWPQQAPRITLCHMILGSVQWTQTADGWDRWPASVTWTHDGAALLVTADQNGRCPIFEVRLDGELTANTADGVEVPSWLVLPRSSVYFPAENHWVLSPQHAKIWYQVVTGSWPSTCWGRASSSPKLWGRRAPVSWRP
jgi:dipeptidyl aminopeptidase/acylaminoacyl peptidase